MSTRMQYEAQAVLNALDEGKVQAVIELNQAGLLEPAATQTKREYLQWILTTHLIMSAEDAEYWLNWFRIN